MSLLSEFKNYSHHEWQKMELGLHRMEKACEALGHPEKLFPSIHVAGTNGKGSVCAILHSILSRAGYRVGLFTSPHLVQVNERFRVGDEEISDEELEEVLWVISERIPLPFARGGLGWGRGLKVLRGATLPPPPNPLLAKEGEVPTFFEICTLIAFLYFAQKKVDIAIIEVGLGGRFDATNGVTPLVSVITEISLDHTDILGHDLASIAKEKAGIIKSGIPVVCAATAREAREAIRSVAQEKKAPVIWVDAPECHPREGGDPMAIKWIPVSTGVTSVFDWGPFKKLQLGLAGRHQIHNAQIALTTLQVLRDVRAYSHTPLQVDETAIREGLAKVRWPGRLEFIQQNPPVILDGAHNPSGMKALVDFLQSPYPSNAPSPIVLPLEGGGIKGEGDLRGRGEGYLWPKKWKILFSASKDKNVDEMLKILREVTNEIAICKMQNARSIAAPPGDAFEIFQGMIKGLKKGEGLIVTGSLYLIGEIKKEIGVRR